MLFEAKALKQMIRIRSNRLCPSTFRYNCDLGNSKSFFNDPVQHRSHPPAKSSWSLGISSLSQYSKPSIPTRTQCFLWFRDDRSSASISKLKNVFLFCSDLARYSSEWDPLREASFLPVSGWYLAASPGFVITKTHGKKVLNLRIRTHQALLGNWSWSWSKWAGTTSRKSHEVGTSVLSQVSNAQWTCNGCDFYTGFSLQAHEACLQDPKFHILSEVEQKTGKPRSE